MNKKILTFLLCFALCFSLIGIVEAKKVKEKCDHEFVASGISELLTKINSNPDYVDFIRNSEYSSVKAVIGGRDYYFLYSDGAVKQVEVANNDFTIRLNCKELEVIIKAYETQDPKFKKKIIKQLPFRVKVSLFNQCMHYDWCKEKVF